MRIARITFGMAAVRRATPLIGFGLVATLAGACTEYGFKGKADGSGGGDGDTGFYESADDSLKVSIAGAAQFNWNGGLFAGENAAGPELRLRCATRTSLGLRCLSRCRGYAAGP